MPVLKMMQKCNLRLISAESCETEDVSKLLSGIDGLLVPGGFGERGNRR